MDGAYYLYIVCGCGHAHTSMLADWPAHLRAHAHLRQDVLDRLKCRNCGRVGRPKTTICGWTNSAQDGG